MWMKRTDLKICFHPQRVLLSHRQRSQQYRHYQTQSRRLKGAKKLQQNRNVSFYSSTALLRRCDGHSNDHRSIASMGLVYTDWCYNPRPMYSLHHVVQHRSWSSTSVNSNSRNNESRLDDDRKDPRNDEELGSKGTKRKEDYNECVKRVQNRDYDAYLCGLLLPKQAREHYFAIRAFNIEIASIKDGGTTMIKRRAAQDGSTSASLATQLRMQWWNDALSLLLQNQRSGSTQQTPSSTTTTTTTTTTTQSSTFFENPLVSCLQHTITQKNLTPRFLERLVTSRSDNLDTLQHPNLHSLLRYSDHTSCSLLYLTLECCDILNDDADEVAFQVGIGVGITQAIRGIVAGCRPGGSGEVGIPMEVMERWGVSLRYLQDPPASAAWAGGIGGVGGAGGEGMEEHDGDRASREALQKAVEEMVHVARYHLGKARSMQGKVPKGASSCFLPAVLAIEYLDRLEGVGFNVFHTDMVEGDSFRASRIRLKRSFLLMRAWLTGVF